MELNNKCILVIDIGTSSIRSSVFSKKGENLFTNQLTYQPEYHKDGGAEQDAQIFFDYCVETIKKCVTYCQRNHHDIVCITLTSQRSSLIPTKDGKPIHNAIMWQDTRVNEVVKNFESYNDFFVERSGSRLNAVYLGSKIAWLKEKKPKIYQEADKLLNIPSFLTFHMTNQYTTDSTYGSRTNLMNIRTLEWDSDLLQILDVDKGKLAKIISPGTSCGNITNDFSKISGLPEGVPVISAGGDQQCASIGEGLVETESVSINTGTGGYIIKNIESLPEELSKNIIYNCSSIDGNYILEIDLLACSSVLNWFLNNFYKDSENKFEELNDDLASRIDDDIILSVLPYPKGKSVGTYDTHIRAAFTNIGLSTTKADMIYALMASLFSEISDGLDILKSYGPISSVTIGGGLTNSDIMNQMQSNSYNMDIVKSPVSEATGIGALIPALVYLNVYSDFREAYVSIVKEKPKKYSPNKKPVGTLNKMKKRNHKLYDILKGTEVGYHKIAKNNY